MPEGYGGLDTEKDVRLGEQDQARRRRANVEGLGASREGGRDRQRDREGLGPVRPGRKRSGQGRSGGGGQGRGQGRGRPAPRNRAGQQENAEQPRTDETTAPAEGRDQATQPPVRDSGPVEAARGNREVPPTESDASPVESTAETTPAPVADAPDTATPQQQTEDSTKQEEADT
jgi:hypothetical protein